MTNEIIKSNTASNSWFIWLPSFVLFGILAVLFAPVDYHWHRQDARQTQTDITKLQEESVGNNQHTPDANVTLAPGRMQHSKEWEDRNAMSGERSTWVERSDELKKKIFTQCKDPRYRVPNVVHYVWLGCDYLFEFYNFISVLTTKANVEPCAIIFHCNCEPSTYWWKKVLQYVDNVYMVYQEEIQEVFGNKLDCIQHVADVIRLRELIKWGGIYFDVTVLGINHFDGLRNLTASMSIENVTRELVCNAIITGEPDSPFLKTWYDESYNDYRAKPYNYNSGYYAYRLAQRRPDLGLHIETEKFLPIYSQWRMMFDEHYPWQNNYAFHFYDDHVIKLIEENKREAPSFPDDIFAMDSSYGEISRSALKKFNVVFD